jgi:uncharacterized integral membrane protein
MLQEINAISAVYPDWHSHLCYWHFIGTLLFFIAGFLFDVFAHELRICTFAGCKREILAANLFVHMRF